MNLLLDIGNSRLKWAIERSDGGYATVALDYRRPGFLADLHRSWLAIDPPQTVAIASVSNRQLLESLVSLSQTLWPQSRLLPPQASSEAFGVKNAYRQPEKLGVDRWLALIAAHHHYAGNLCIVDCGTAVTVDVLQADGRHLGGLICPGLNLMKQALVANTADLDFTMQAYRNGLGTATDVAIANGVCAAVTGLIEQTLRNLDAGYRLLLTGGDAAYIAEPLSLPHLLDLDLVLKGLSIFCRGEPRS